MTRAQVAQDLRDRCAPELWEGVAQFSVERYLMSARRILGLAPTLERSDGVLRWLDVGPFLPFTLLVRDYLRDALHLEVDLTVIELPSESPETVVRRLRDLAARHGAFEWAFLNVEVEEIPRALSGFHLVTLMEVVEHLYLDPFHAIKGLRGCLVNRGRLFVTTDNVNSLYHKARVMAGRNIYYGYSPGNPYGRHNREFLGSELAYLLESSGFRVETLHYLPVFDFPSRTRLKAFFAWMYKCLQTVGYWIGLKYGDRLVAVARKDPAREPTFPQRLYRTPRMLNTMARLDGQVRQAR